MNIAVVNMPIEFYNPVTGGAVSTVIRELSAALIARGHHLSILTTLDANPTYTTGDIHPIDGISPEGKSTLARLWGKALRTWFRWDYPRYSFYLSSVLRTLRKLPPQDAIVVHNDFMLAFHLRAALGPQPKIISYVHNEPHSAFRHLRAATDATDLFIAISNFIAGRIHTVLGVPRDRIATVLNGVNITRFTPAPAAPTKTACRALFVGRINADKGPDIAVEAVKRLRSEGLPLTLDVAGPVWWHGQSIDTNPYAKSVKDAVESGLGTFLGDVPRDDVPALMRNYDILFAPSRWQEPYALVVSEGMASGCALIGSNRGGIPEVIAGAGELVDPDNLDDVCAKTRRLVTDTAHRAHLKQAGRARAEQLSWAHAAEAFEAAVLGVRR